MSPKMDAPVIAAIVGLGWWGRKMATLVNSGEADLRFARGIDPNPEAADFARSLGIDRKSVV